MHSTMRQFAAVFFIGGTVFGCGSETEAPPIWVSVDCARIQQTDGITIDCGNNGNENTTIYGSSDPIPSGETSGPCEGAEDCSSLVPLCEGQVGCKSHQCTCSGKISNFGAPCGSYKAFDADGVCKHYEIGESCSEGKDCPVEICHDAVCVAGACIIFLDEDGTICGEKPVSACSEGICIPFFSPTPAGH